MEENNQVIIDIGIDAMIESLRQLQKQYEANTAAMKALRDEGKQDSDEYIQLTQANKVLRQEMNGVEKSIQNNIKAEKAQEGSLVQLRAQLANLNKQYDSMSGFERMGTAGEALRSKIKALSDNISSLEANTGRYQRNVGNYKSALEGLSGSFKMAGLSTKGLDQSLKLLNGNPIMLLLTSIVTIGRQLIQAFKGNEEATMALRQAFSAFNPIIDIAKKGLETFANVVVKVVTGAVNGLTTAIGWLLDKVQDIGNFFGADWHMGDNFREGVQAARELQAAENDYIKAKREWSVESAKIDREVADLRAKVADKERYSAQEREQYLKRAMDLEEQKAAREKELAEQNLANLQAEAKRSANSAEVNERLAEAERAVIEADTRLSETQRNLTKEMNRLHNEIRQDGQQAWNEYVAKIKEAREECKGLIAELKKINLADLEDPIEKATEALISLSKAEKEAIEYQKKLTETIAASYGDLDEFAERLERQSNPLYNFAQKYEENAQLIEQTSSALQSSFGSVAAMYKQMAEDETKTEEERAAAARKAKTWAAMQIAANAGTAIAKGVASAVDVGFPAAIPAMATMLAAILAAIAQAKALASEGMETGGVIGGFRGATMGSDNTYIHARRGEMVLNAEQQRKLFEVANGNTTNNMAAQLAQAIAAMPAPVMDYSEFLTFTGKVANLNELTKLS